LKTSQRSETHGPLDQLSRPLRILPKKTRLRSTHTREERVPLRPRLHTRTRKTGAMAAEWLFINSSSEHVLYNEAPKNAQGCNPPSAAAKRRYSRDAGLVSMTFRISCGAATPPISISIDAYQNRSYAAKPNRAVTSVGPYPLTKSYTYPTPPSIQSGGCVIALTVGKYTATCLAEGLRIQITCRGIRGIAQPDVRTKTSVKDRKVRNFKVGWGGV